MSTDVYRCSDYVEVLHLHASNASRYVFCSHDSVWSFHQNGEGWHMYCWSIPFFSLFFIFHVDAHKLRWPCANRPLLLLQTVLAAKSQAIYVSEVVTQNLSFRFLRILPYCKPRRLGLLGITAICSQSMYSELYLIWIDLGVQCIVYSIHSVFAFDPPGRAWPSSFASLPRGWERWSSIVQRCFI